MVTLHSLNMEVTNWEKVFLQMVPDPVQQPPVCNAKVLQSTDRSPGPRDGGPCAY